MLTLLREAAKQPKLWQLVLESAARALGAALIGLAADEARDRLRCRRSSRRQRHAKRKEVRK